MDRIFEVLEGLLERDFEVKDRHARVEAMKSPAVGRIVVSRADFGRAYLSDSWATRFISRC